MRKTITILYILFFSIITSYAQQDLLLGIKGGINYSFGAEIEAQGVPASGYNGGSYNSEFKEGFHGGIYGQKSFRKLFVRVEALYNTMKSDFQFDKRPASYTLDKVSIPILFGYHIYKPIDVYIGPGLSVVVGDADLEHEEQYEGVIPVDKSYFSANIGAKAHFGRFEIDLRYEHNFSSSEETPIVLDFTSFGSGVNSVFKNKRINQLMLSVSFALFDSNYIPRRKADRGCYFKKKQ